MRGSWDRGKKGVLQIGPWAVSVLGPSHGPHLQDSVGQMTSIFLPATAKDAKLLRPLGTDRRICGNSGGLCQKKDKREKEESKKNKKDEKEGEIKRRKG